MGYDQLEAVDVARALGAGMAKLVLREPFENQPDRY